MLRFGVIGCGQHAEWAVMPAIVEASKRCELVAAADISPENLQRACKYPGVATYGDFREMIGAERLDAVYVATAVPAHCDATVAALQAGLHVVCEKPMAETVEQCERMLAAASQADRRIAVTFETRYYPYLKTIRRWIVDGRLGTVGAVHVKMFWDGYKITSELGPRRARLIDASGGLDCGIHKVDMVRYLVGGGEWKDIHAIGAWLGEPRKKAPHISILASLSSGPLVTIDVSMGYTSQIKAVASSSGLTIVGDKGVVDKTTDENGKRLATLTSDTLSESVPISGGSHKDTIGWLIDDFADVIAGQKPPPDALAQGTDGLMAQIIVEEANRQALLPPTERY